ncbi:phospho-N-acetylmuramoyl-pentapeptide-transferase [Saprospiraceae bacterium]|nr:phospho-N-acetylmuramoyl-pentapeptide-transferase [Saprospiraceae bacterium]
MLYYLFDFLEKNYDSLGAGLFQYISFRSGMAIVMSMLISLFFGKRVIRSLRNLQVGESVRDLGLEGQKEKEGTPTMGGLLIILALLIPVLLLTKLHNVYIQLMILSTLWMGSIGFVDDYLKIRRKNKDGLAGKFKIVGQIGLGLIVALTMLFHDDVVVRVPLADAQTEGYEIIRTDILPVTKGVEVIQMAYVKSTFTNFPFLKENAFEYRSLIGFLGDNSGSLVWLLFIPIVIFIVTGVSNAANLTDGIDGLAAGVSAIIVATLGVLAYISGNTIISDYLNILYIPYTGELVVFAAAFLGSLIGFLWFNTYPAKVFMGDTGSLMIGGIIAALAIVIRKEFLLPIMCGIFVVETLSVIMQVSYFKYTKKKTGEGQRIFLMSPLHHHYQKKGIHEAQIVVRFWIVGIILAVATIITLKMQ